MKINRRNLLSCLPAGVLTCAGIGPAEAASGAKPIAGEALNNTVILVLDREGRKAAWQTVLTSEAAARGWPALPEVRHLVDVLDQEKWPSYAVDEWNAFLSSDLYALGRCPSDRTPGDTLIQTSLPSGVPSGQTYSLRNAAGEAFYRLVGFLKGGPFSPIDRDHVHCHGSPLPLLATIVAGDHPLDLAMGRVAGDGGLKSVFWAGEYRHGPNVYTEAVVLRRPNAQSLEMTAGRHQEIAVQVLDGIESLWSELASATGAPVFTSIQRDYWV